MNDLVSRKAAIDALWKALYEYEDETEQKFQASDELSIDDWFMHRIFVQNMSDIDRQTILNLPSAQPEGYIKIPETGIDDLSDGFHTFRQLYYQRMMLFAAIVKQNKDKAWKSLRHEDGELCFGGGWFIVGIDTPEGSYTYHYEDKYFSLFDCEELEHGKHWDGHTEKDVTRLLSLPPAQQWHPITSRPMDEEERKYWNELRGYTLEDDEAVIYSGCPDDGDEVLVCTALGNVYIDTFYSDPDEGCYFEGSGDMDGIVAWMPKPAPYKEER